MRTLGRPSESMRYPESVREGNLKQPGPKQEPTVSETCVVSQKYQSKIFALLFPITKLSVEGISDEWKTERSRVLSSRRDEKVRRQKLQVQATLAAFL